MDERTDNLDNQESREQGYTPRPAYQIWLARIGLVFMILFVIYQIITIATGGLV
jgi:hypothetical protein